jgi:hypothetical protein
MGLQRFRVYVDRDLVPNWFDREGIGVCTRRNVKGAYGLSQMKRACDGERLGGGWKARVAFRDGHSEKFGAELFAARRLDGGRGLLLHLYRLGYSRSGPVVNLWGPLYHPRYGRGHYRWAYLIRVPSLKDRRGELNSAVVTKLTVEFDVGSKAWRGRCDDRHLAFAARIVVRGAAPQLTRRAKTCQPTG